MQMHWDTFKCGPIAVRNEDAIRAPWVLPRKDTNIYALKMHLKSFHEPQFKGPCLYLGNCWFPAFITICLSLGVRCSAPPPGGTYTNEDTTSNEHPPPSVLNYRAVPLPEPTQHPELQQTPAETQAPQTPLSPRAETEDTRPCRPCCRAMFAGRSSEALYACLCVGKRVFVHYTVSCATIWYKLKQAVGSWVDWWLNMQLQVHVWHVVRPWIIA